VVRVKESYQKQVDKVAALFVEYQEREQACTAIEWEDARKLAYDEGFKAGQESMQQSCVCILHRLPVPDLALDVCVMSYVNPMLADDGVDA
jgi:flagellar biosynthesis/type III secretory pathway protein FliH